METISKAESAKRHLVEAIKLFFEERDSLAIHTLAAAAQGTLRDIARVSGAERLSILHDHSDIAPEHKKTGSMLLTRQGISLSTERTIRTGFSNSMNLTMLWYFLMQYFYIGR